MFEAANFETKMRASKDRLEFVHEFLNRVFGGDLHAERVESLPVA